MTKLRRVLGLFSLTLYGIGIILGAGIYVLVGKAAAIAGNAVWISFLLAAAIALFTGLSYCELASMYPKAAPEYTYVKIAFENPLLSFLAGWIAIFLTITGAATVALGFSNYLNELISSPLPGSAILLITALSLLNSYGIKESSRINIIFTSIEMFGLLIIIGIGVPFLGRINYFESPSGINSIFSAALLVFFAYLGFEYVATLGEESKEARKIVPKATIFSILITTLLYVAVAISAVSVVGWEELGKSNAPFILVASKVLGENAIPLLSLIALFATSNTVLISLISGSRITYGMACANSLPKILASIHEKRRTPLYAILFVMILSIVFVLVGKIEILAETTSLGSLLIFSLVNLSLIKMRLSKIGVRRFFKVPLNIGKFPLPPSFGLIFSIFLMFQITLDVMLILLAIILTGCLAFYLMEKFKK